MPIGRRRWPDPPPHPSGQRPPAIPQNLIPRHVAVVMDGNGRWANQRGLPRTEGHRAGEAALMDVLFGAIELGIEVISAYAFSTENWRRSPDEVRFLMGFNKEVLARRRDELSALGVRIRWAGRRPRLWRSVISQLEEAEQLTRNNDRLTLQFCVNYGGRAEVVDAARRIAELAAAGQLNPAKLDERTFARFLDEPGLPDVDLFVRCSGEQRTSNFLLWQSAYAELMFMNTLWPDFDRRHLWAAVESYARRDRRFGGAIDRAAEQAELAVEQNESSQPDEPDEQPGSQAVEPSGSGQPAEPSGSGRPAEPSGSGQPAEPGTDPAGPDGQRTSVPR